jgi:hypothetical protein
MSQGYEANHSGKFLESIAYLEKEILLLYGGRGARKKIIDYIKQEAVKIRGKKVWVLNINEFPGWVKQEFIGLRAVS